MHLWGDKPWREFANMSQSPTVQISGYHAVSIVGGCCWFVLGEEGGGWCCFLLLRIRVVNFLYTFPFVSVKCSVPFHVLLDCKVLTSRWKHIVDVQCL